MAPTTTEKKAGKTARSGDVATPGLGFSEQGGEVVQHDTEALPATVSAAEINAQNRARGGGLG